MTDILKVKIDGQWVGIPAITGPKGIKGDKGDKGDTGEQGPKGDKGDTGAQGPAATIAAGATTTVAYGSAAAVENVGTSGAAVFNFAIPSGPQGPQGDTGIQGPKGDTGDKGEQGKDFTVKGYFATYADLQAGVPSPEAGDAYGVGTAKPYDIYIWDGVNLEWVNIGELVDYAHVDHTHNISNIINLSDTLSSMEDEILLLKDLVNGDMSGGIPFTIDLFDLENTTIVDGTLNMGRRTIDA